MSNAELNAKFQSVYESLSHEKLKFKDDPSSKAQIFRQIAAQQYYAAHTERTYSSFRFSNSKFVDQKFLSTEMMTVKLPLLLMKTLSRNTSKSWMRKNHLRDWTAALEEFKLCAVVSKMVLDTY